MPTQTQSFIDQFLAHHAIPCYTPEQIYGFEKDWFTHNDSFGLMQQAAWQMANWLKQSFKQSQKTVLIVTGNGNNGGDGWALASFLTSLCPAWQITVLQIASPTTEDAKQAKKRFKGDVFDLATFLTLQERVYFHFDCIIEALFGIGLNKQPKGDFAKIIDWINMYKQRFATCQVIAIDVPSGLNARTGEVYTHVAIKADITLCLLARKVGLHLKDSKDYVGEVIDLPLIPVPPTGKIFYHKQLPKPPKRPNNSHKGSYGHVLIIGGNKLETGENTGQGMAGASLLSASCAFAVGVGKVTVACHGEFAQSIITALPNAMTADLYQVKTLSSLINQVDVVAIGMGLGRDKSSFELFKSYLLAIIQAKKPCIIDADGLYHLVNIPKTLLNQLKKSADFYFTPHSGEAGRLLGQDFSEIDSDKITAIQALSEKFGGTWLIKGAQTLVLEGSKLYICGLGNAGMATAGMGDVLSGVVAGVVAQNEIFHTVTPLVVATLIHAKAADKLADDMGEYALSAHAMSQAIGEIIDDRTDVKTDV